MPLDDRLAELCWQVAFGPPLDPGLGPWVVALLQRMDAIADPGVTGEDLLAWTRRRPATG